MTKDPGLRVITRALRDRSQFSDHPGRYGERPAGEMRPARFTFGEPLRDFLEGALALIAQWRAQADRLLGVHRGISDATAGWQSDLLKACADELEAAMSLAEPHTVLVKKARPVQQAQNILCMNPSCHLMREHTPDECGWPR